MWLVSCQLECVLLNRQCLISWRVFHLPEGVSLARGCPLLVDRVVLVRECPIG